MSPPSALALPPAPSLSRPCRTDWFGEAVGQGAGAGLRGQGSPSPPAPLCLHIAPQTFPDRTWWPEHPVARVTPPRPEPPAPSSVFGDFVGGSRAVQAHCGDDFGVSASFPVSPKTPVPAKGGTGTSCPAHPTMSPPRASGHKVRNRLPYYQHPMVTTGPGLASLSPASKIHLPRMLLSQQWLPQRQ